MGNDSSQPASSNPICMVSCFAGSETNDESYRKIRNGPAREVLGKLANRKGGIDGGDDEAIFLEKLRGHLESWQKAMAAAGTNDPDPIRLEDALNYLKEALRLGIEAGKATQNPALKMHFFVINPANASGQFVGCWPMEGCLPHELVPELKFTEEQLVQCVETYQVCALRSSSCLGLSHLTL